MTGKAAIYCNFVELYQCRPSFMNIPAAGNRHSGKTETANPAQGNRWSGEMETIIPVGGSRLCEA